MTKQCSSCSGRGNLRRIFHPGGNGFTPKHSGTTQVLYVDTTSSPIGQAVREILLPQTDRQTFFLKKGNFSRHNFLTDKRSTYLRFFCLPEDSLHSAVAIQKISKEIEPEYCIQSTMSSTHIPTIIVSLFQRSNFPEPH